MRKFFLAGAVLFVSIAVQARPNEGFFAPERNEDAPTAKVDGFACALQMRFNASAPLLFELTYIGTGCIATNLAAINAAASGAKVSVPGEPAQAPSYGCALTVAWNPAAAATPQTTMAGGPACDVARALALKAARQAVACMYQPGTSCNL